MKILFFVDRLLHGGIQTLLLNLTTELKRKHSDILIDFLNFDDGNAYELESVMKNMGCEVYKVTMPHAKTLSKTLSELDIFFKYHHDYDIIHAHCSSKGALPLYYAKKYGIKVRIAHSHNTKFQTQNHFTILVGNILKAPLCLLATDYFACSKLAGKWLFDNIFSKKNIKVKLLNNAIQLDNYLFNPKIRNDVRKEFNIDENIVVIGNIGRFSLQKNHTFMIRVFLKFHELNNKSKLLLVGKGELEEDIINEIKTLGLENDVLFAGFRRDTYRLYQAMDLFLMPSLYEGLPFAGIEAQASGLPCLFSENVTKDVGVIESSRFLSLSLSVNQWAKQMDEMLKSSVRKNTSKELTNAGYNISSESERLYNYYSQSIEQS